MMEEILTVAFAAEGARECFLKNPLTKLLLPMVKSVVSLSRYFSKAAASPDSLSRFTEEILGAFDAAIQKEVSAVYALIKLLIDNTRSATQPAEQKDLRLVLSEMRIA